MRLKSSIWVAAYLRRCQTEGVFGAVRKRGAEEAGAVFVKVAMLDGNARLNLATFVGTWMDPFASRLYAESADKNMVDKDEYPQTAAIETRCWKMIASLWNSPDA